MCLEHLATGVTISWREALTYATRHIDGFLFGPLVFGVLLLLLGVIEVLVLFIGRIPFLGELIIAVAFLPLLLLNVLATITLLFGGWLLFAVVASEGASAISGPLRVFELVRRDPVRIVVQTCIAFFISGLAVFILGFLLSLSFGITAVLSGVGLGWDKASQILGGFMGPFASVLGPAGFGAARPPITIGIAHFLLQIAITAFVGILWALPTVFLYSSACAVYLAGVPERLGVRTVAPTMSESGPIGEPA
jgi:hypothetical protein